MFSTGQTRALILSAYIKMINLFPEIKNLIESVLRSEVLQKNADIELQQRALEYFKVWLIDYDSLDYDSLDYDSLEYDS